ncbi:DUF262 domain-containing protein [Myxococcus sp. AM011]|uniref:DUF262 domain-containing protein n=1 Tax=Myxococcus sp. AM011 TaxID=2745200 RepID=UPI0015959C25|nr:DUF262 domain-containing protein [Myxococcus sp. AM011]NVJ21741.1 DUF262 domain-containing protein [Myxococcus sp. AM011]
MADWTIREIIDAVTRGQIRVPSFQRGFVWEPDDVAFLMDSIYKKYPFGSLLFWRTKEALRTERQLGPFALPKKDPDYPVDYILDGQQRITSLFGVFQTELKPLRSEPWTKIYFDHSLSKDAQESQFIALEDSEVDPKKHFPLRVLFDTVAYRKATKDLDDNLAKRIDEMQSIFKEARLPIQTISIENRAAVAIVFERVNRSGVELDTLQLLAAWTWSEDFGLDEKFSELEADLKPFGFEDLGANKDLLLRCCAAVIAQDASPDTLVKLNGKVVRDRFTEIVNGVKGAIDFLQKNLNVHSLDNLPFSTVLVPLSVFFAIPGNQHNKTTNNQLKAIVRWFWRCCFSKRYSSGVLRNLKTDIEEMLKLKSNQPSDLGNFNVTVTAKNFTDDTFRVGNVTTKTFILMMAQRGPLSFISGQPISLAKVLRESNRNEFHHVYPKAYLLKQDPKSTSHSCLANFCFLSRTDNSQISDDAPSVYRARMPDDVTQILSHALLPDTMFNDNYAGFLAARAKLQTAEAQRLMQ